MTLWVCRSAANSVGQISATVRTAITVLRQAIPLFKDIAPPFGLSDGETSLRDSNLKNE
jgi:hypothetical protein